MAPITTIQMRRVASTASRAAQTVGFQKEKRIIGVWQEGKSALTYQHVVRGWWVVSSTRPCAS